MIKRPIFSPRINIGQQGPPGGASGPASAVIDNFASFADTSGDNYTCDFKTLASTSFSNFKFISNGDEFDESPGKITIQENPTGKIITLNNCIFNLPLAE